MNIVRQIAIRWCTLSSGIHLRDGFLTLPLQNRQMRGSVAIIQFVERCYPLSMIFFWMRWFNCAILRFCAVYIAKATTPVYTRNLNTIRVQYTLHTYKTTIITILWRMKLSEYKATAKKGTTERYSAWLASTPSHPKAALNLQKQLNAQHWSSQQIWRYHRVPVRHSSISWPGHGMYLVVVAVAWRPSRSTRRNHQHEQSSILSSSWSHTPCWSRTCLLATPFYCSWGEGDQ